MFKTGNNLNAINLTHKLNPPNLYNKAKKIIETEQTSLITRINPNKRPQDPRQQAGRIKKNKKKHQNRWTKKQHFLDKFYLP